MKASINTKKGTRIIIEGKEGEITRVINMFKEESNTSSNIPESKKFTKLPNKTRFSATGMIMTFQAERFFDKPKTLVQIRTALEEQGHFYPITTLSGVVLALVKKRRLRRIKNNKIWEYVK